MNNTTLKEVPGLGPVIRDALMDICMSRLDSFEPTKLSELKRLNFDEFQPLGNTGSWIYYLVRGIDNRPVKGKVLRLGFETFLKMFFFKTRVLLPRLEYSMLIDFNARACMRCMESF